MPDTLAESRQRTAAARAALAAKFPDQESKSDYYRRLANKSHAGRVVLSADDAKSLVESRRALDRLVDIVGRIAERMESRTDREHQSSSE